MKKVCRYIYYFAAGMIVFLSVAVLSGHLSITTTPSMKYRIWFIFSPGDDLDRGSYIRFLFRDPFGFVGEEGSAIKRVVCIPGDHLKSDAQRNFFCNGRFIGKGKNFSLQGVPAPHFAYDGEIPKGKYFVMGDHPDSYDSRYFGFVSKEDVLSEAKPIF